MKLQSDGRLLVTGEKEVSLTAGDLGIHVSSLRLDLTANDANGGERQKISFALSATDQANQLPLSLGGRTVARGVAQTQDVNLQLAGKSIKLIVKLSCEKRDTLTLNALELNPRRPFQRLTGRWLWVGIGLWLLYLLNPKHRSLWLFTRCLCSVRADF